MFEAFVTPKPEQLAATPNLDEMMREHQDMENARRRIDSFHNHYKRICRAVGVVITPYDFEVDHRVPSERLRHALEFHETEVARAEKATDDPSKEPLHGEISESQMSEALKHFRTYATRYFAEEIMKSKRPLKAKQICVLLDARNDRSRTDGIKWVDRYHTHPDEIYEVFRSAKRTLKKHGISVPEKDVKSNSNKLTRNEPRNSGLHRPQ